MKTEISEGQSLKERALNSQAAVKKEEKISTAARADDKARTIRSAVIGGGAAAIVFVLGLAVTSEKGGEFLRMMGNMLYTGGAAVVVGIPSVIRSGLFRPRASAGNSLGGSVSPSANYSSPTYR